MISIQGYYDTIYQNFIKPRMPLFEESLSYPIEEDEEALQASPALTAILDQVYEKYDFGLHRQIRPNLQQFDLFQRQICGKRDKERTEAALVFVLFCCLADKFLDSRRFTDEEKEHICQKLDARYLLSEAPFVSEHFTEMDALLDHLRTFFAKHPDAPHMQAVIEDIQEAFLSEIYMAKTRLELRETAARKDLHLLTDKSIKFERAAFLLSVFGDITPDAETIADSIAKIIWLVDDLCDFVEDVQCKRKNSVLFLYTDETQALSLTERIEQAYKELPAVYTLLDEEIERLRMCATPRLYHFIITQVWDWSRHVRKETADRAQA